MNELLCRPFARVPHKNVTVTSCSYNAEWTLLILCMHTHASELNGCHKNILFIVGNWKRLLSDGYLQFYIAPCLDVVNLVTPLTASWYTKKLSLNTISAMLEMSIS